MNIKPANFMASSNKGFRPLVYLWITLPLVYGQSENLSTRAQLDHERRAATIKVAYAEFERGEAQSAIATVTSAIGQEARLAHVDLRVARLLAGISLSFKNNKNFVRAAEVAAIAVGRVQTPQGRMSAKDASASLVLAAELSEIVLGDTVKAQELFKQALIVAPDSKSAREGLQRLAAIDEAASAKASANALLVQRNAQMKR